MTRFTRAAGAGVALAILVGFSATAPAQDPSPASGLSKGAGLAGIPPSVSVASEAALVARIREVAPSPSAATTTPGPAIGERVRIKTSDPAIGAKDKWIAGRITADDGDVLELERGDGRGTIQVSRRTIREFEISNGRRRGRPAAIGAGLGALAGLGIGYLSYQSCHSFLCGVNLLAGPILGAPVGAIVGGAIGQENWTRVPVPSLTINAAPRPGGFVIGGAFQF